MYLQGRRSKMESGKAKFCGQLLASFVNRIGDFYNFWNLNNSLLKAAHARGSGECSWSGFAWYVLIGPWALCALGLISSKSPAHVTYITCIHTYTQTYHTVKNHGGKKNLVGYSNSSSSFANFHYFHNIPFANRLQFANFLCQTSCNPYSPDYFIAKVFYHTV